MALEGYSAFPKTPAPVRLFSAIYRTLVGGGVLPSEEMQSVYFAAPADCAISYFRYMFACVFMCACVRVYFYMKRFFLIALLLQTICVDFFFFFFFHYWDSNTTWFHQTSYHALHFLYERKHQLRKHIIWTLNKPLFSFLCKRTGTHTQIYIYIYTHTHKHTHTNTHTHTHTYIYIYI